MYISTVLLGTGKTIVVVVHLLLAQYKMVFGLINEAEVLEPRIKGMKNLLSIMFTCLICLSEIKVKTVNVLSTPTVGSF